MSNVPVASVKSKPKRVKPSDSPDEGSLNAFCSGLAATVNKKFKDSELVNYNMAGRNPVQGWVLTGIAGFDWALSKGRGFPIGRAVQIWGDEQTGKSAFSQYIIGKWSNRENGVVLLLDYEGSLDEDHANKYGWNWKRINHTFPETMEEGWNIIWEAWKALRDNQDNTELLVVWDSVAAAPTAEEESKGAGELSVGSQARVMSRECRKLRRRLSKLPWSFLFTNQLRQKIGGMGYGEQLSRPAGKALDFVCDVRCRFQRIGDMSKGSGADRVITGYKIKATMDKNRLAPPKRRTEWILSFSGEGAGPDAAQTAFILLKEARLLKPAGRSVKLVAKGHEKEFKGLQEFRKYFVDHEESINGLLKAHLDKSDTASAASDEGTDE